MNKVVIRKMTFTAMLTAVGLILGMLSFPIFPQVPFLEYDLCDVSVLIVSFMFGPLYALASSLTVSVFQAFILSKAGAFGFLMNVVSTTALALPASIIYNGFGKNNIVKSKKRAVMSLMVGWAVMNVTMVVFNLVITPAFTGMPVGAVIKNFLIFIVLFNLIKSSLNSTITFFVYKHISKIIKKFN